MDVGYCDGENVSANESSLLFHMEHAGEYSHHYLAIHTYTTTLTTYDHDEVFFLSYETLYYY